MLFTKAIYTILSVASVFADLNHALPVEADTSVSANITKRDPYPLTCNDLVLPPNEIEACATDLIARGDEVLSITKANGYMHLCDIGEVFVSARAWGEQGASAKAKDCGNVVKGVFIWCGNRGGSFSANGDQGGKLFIVHVADQWV